MTEIVYQATGRAFTKCQLQSLFSKINVSLMMQPVHQHVDFPGKFNIEIVDKICYKTLLKQHVLIKRQFVCA